MHRARGAVAGYRCRVCGTQLPITTPLPWRCPKSTNVDRRHALALEVQPGPSGAAALEAARIIALAGGVGSTGVTGGQSGSSGPTGSAADRGNDSATTATEGDLDPDRSSSNPFLAFRQSLAWDAFARNLGVPDEVRIEAITVFDEQVAAVAGTGFRFTPFSRSDALSAALGFNPSGGVWVKDETGNVGGSHKARHLVTTMLQLQTAESMRVAPWAGPTERPPLAISSCGNAAIAAATIAAAVHWPIRVFVPVWADAAVIDTLTSLGATVLRCQRHDGDPPGDPCVREFRKAVAAGAIPFSVQGTENVTTLDGGRILGWEIDQQARGLGVSLDRVLVQVGGGALASCVGAARLAPRFHAVQTEGCAPLERAWARAGDLVGGVYEAAVHWKECMWPWEQEPHSAADGILDDETYDWLGVFEAMINADGNGWPIVASEADVLAAHHLARTTTPINVSATGTAGLAGLLAIAGQVGPDERVAVIFSGLQRS